MRDTFQDVLFFSPHILQSLYNEDTHTVVLDTPSVYVSPIPYAVADILLRPFGIDWAGKESQTTDSQVHIQ